MIIETLDTPLAVVTREVRAGGRALGHQELAEDMTQRGFDPSRYPPSIQEGLRQARARGMGRSPQEAALFACAFAAAAEDLAGREHAALAGTRASAERAALAERRRQEAERRAEIGRQAARLVAERRAIALSHATEDVARAGYVPASGCDDVARIMVERGLSVGDAYDAWVAAGPPSPALGLRLGFTIR